MLLPEDLFYKILKENKVEEERINTILSFHNEYNEAFYRNIQHFKYLMLLDESYLESVLLEDSEIEYKFLSLIAGKSVKVSKEYCCYHLKHIINLMNRFKNFEIALSSNREDDRFNNIGIFIKQYKAIIAYSGELKAIYSRENIIIDTLYTYYSKMLKAICIYNKNKEIVEEKIKKLIRLHIEDFEISTP